MKSKVTIYYDFGGHDIFDDITFANVESGVVEIHNDNNVVTIVPLHNIIKIVTKITILNECMCGKCPSCIDGINKFQELTRGDQ